MKDAIKNALIERALKVFEDTACKQTYDMRAGITAVVELLTAGTSALNDDAARAGFENAHYEALQSDPNLLRRGRNGEYMNLRVASDWGFYKQAWTDAQLALPSPALVAEMCAMYAEIYDQDYGPCDPSSPVTEACTEIASACRDHAVTAAMYRTTRKDMPKLVTVLSDRARKAEEQVKCYQAVCAVAYQLAGGYYTDVIYLDMLLNAANGDPQPVDDSMRLLPILGGPKAHELALTQSDEGAIRELADAVHSAIMNLDVEHLRPRWYGPYLRQVFNLGARAARHQASVRAMEMITDSGTILPDREGYERECMEMAAEGIQFWKDKHDAWMIAAGTLSAQLFENGFNSEAAVKDLQEALTDLHQLYTKGAEERAEEFRNKS